MAEKIPREGPGWQPNLRTRLFRCAALFVLVAPLHAAAIVINSPLLAVVDSLAGSRGGFKYRLSNTNFDQSLDNGVGTVSSANFIQANLGNIAALSARPYEFVLEHRPGEGFVFSMTRTGAPASILSWGTFANPPGGTSAAALNGITPGGSFNLLPLSFRASATDSTMSFGNFSFTAPAGFCQYGSFEVGVVAPTTNGPGDPAGFWNQEIASTVDLASGTGRDWRPAQSGVSFRGPTTCP